MDMLVRRNRPLVEVLKDASSEELVPLADAITDHGKGRVSLDKPILDLIEEHKAGGTLPMIASLLDAELRRFGGNSAVNFVRRDGVRYDILLADVAEHLGMKLAKGLGPHEIETEILAHLSKLERTEPEGTEQRPTSVLEGVMSTLPAGIRGGISARGLGQVAAKLSTATSATALGARVLAVAAPIAAAPVTGALLAYEATTPALRVTVPAVKAIAAIRMRQIAEDYAQYIRTLEDLR